MAATSERGVERVLPVRLTELASRVVWSPEAIASRRYASDRRWKRPLRAEGASITMVGAVSRS